jgi:hypothetical protein
MARVPDRNPGILGRSQAPEHSGTVAVSKKDFSEFWPTTADFVISADGPFVGESPPLNRPKS